MTTDATTTSSKMRSGAGCLTLFALPFAGVGVFMAGLIALAVYNHVRMSHWTEVPCRILAVELEEHRGDDSTSYELTARYSYSYQEREYTAERVSLHGGSDSVGSFHQQKNHELKPYLTNGESFRCFVNPDKPSEAILYRQLRWELLGFYTIFVLTFGGVGFGLLGASVYALRTERIEANHRQQYSQEPWRWKEGWATGEVRSSSKVRMIAVVLFAAFWNLVSAPVLFVVPSEVMDNGNKLALLTLLFPLIGAGLILWAVYEVLAWRKYGQSVFRMDTVPGVLGGQLAGVVRTTAKVFPQDGYRLKLTCIRRTTTGSGKRRSTSETVEWDDEQRINQELYSGGLGGSEIPVQFGIPYNLPESTVDDGRSRIIWRLDITAATPGVDYRASFDVPVFKTEQSREDFQADQPAANQYAEPRDAQQTFFESGVVRVPAPGGFGERFVFPMGRHLGNTIGLVVFMVFWGGAIALILHKEGPGFFAIVFGLIEFVLVFACLDLMFYRSVVDASTQGLSVRGGLLGIGRTRTFARDQIRDIQARKGMQSGKTLYFSIVAATADGKKTTLGKRMRGRRVAESVVDEIRTALGR